MAGTQVPHRNQGTGATSQEKEEQSKRESMFIVNEWASQYFQDLLHNNADGVAIGMQYFRSRGFRDDVISAFHLGYDVNDRLALGREALHKGYKEEFVTATGLCYKNDRGELIDRYAGRVVFPWIGVSGKVVGFHGPRARPAYQRRQSEIRQLARQ